MTRSIDHYEPEAWEEEEREWEDKQLKALHDFFSDGADGVPGSSDVETGQGVYVVSVELYGHDNHDYGPFYRALAELQAKQVLRFLWLISTTQMTAIEIRERLSWYLDRRDHLFVATLSHITAPRV